MAKGCAETVSRVWDRVLAERPDPMGGVGWLDVRS